MPKFFKKEERTELSKAIDVRIENLSVTSGVPEEDKIAIDNLKELIDAKVELEGPKHKVNPNTVISAVGSLLGVALIIGHERLHVITTKAMGFLPKIKS